MERISYPTDLTDEEWQRLEPLLPDSRKPGRPRQHSWRTILNAIFYVLRTGCQWRCLPHDMPKWKTVYHYFRRWRQAPVWVRLHAQLREQLRATLGREAQPSAGIIDSQSVKTTGIGGERGYDGAKQIKGRKRHLLVDTQGLVLTVKVHPADIMDRDGVALLLPPELIQAAFPRLTHVWLDVGYNGFIPCLKELPVFLGGDAALRVGGMRVEDPIGNGQNRSLLPRFNKLGVSFPVVSLPIFGCL